MSPPDDYAAVPRRVLGEAHPWTAFLPEADVDQLLAELELVAVAQGAASSENPSSAPTLLAQWRHTAEVYADPLLLEILTRERRGISAPCPRRWMSGDPAQGSRPLVKRWMGDGSCRTAAVR